MENIKVLEQLYRYIAHGYSLFPVHSVKDSKCTCANKDCKSIGKHSKTYNGLMNATNNIKTIKEMSNLWIDSNIGIATGRVSGIVVLDVDPRDDGDELLRVLTAQYQDLPRTVTALSGGGGLHYYFKYPESGIMSRNAFRSGLDFKSDDDWIIAPQSIHKSGQTYKWQEGFSPSDIPLALLPEWLHNLITS
ncbi:MAG TPA: hypothetical protein DDX14_09285 [Cyanobacteria bacterium UBA9579]|nr:hypothetical protein [Cyanobacteria bacterium UBA9579]